MHANWFRAAITVTVVAVLAITPALLAQDGDPAQPQPADQAPRVATLGQLAPDFTLKDHAGNDVKLSDLRGKIVVLEWFNPQCPYVVHHYKEGVRTMVNLASKYKDKDVVWLAINSSDFSTQAFNAEWVNTWSIPYQLLDDASGTVGRTYGATRTPHMYIIDKDGKLVYVGGIDDNPFGRKATTNAYVDKALGELTNGQAVTTTRSQPYGCTVKYAR